MGVFISLLLEGKVSAKLTDEASYSQIPDSDTSSGPAGHLLLKEKALNVCPKSDTKYCDLPPCFPTEYSV